MSKELRASLSLKIVKGFLHSVSRQEDKKVDAKYVFFSVYVCRKVVWLSPFILQNSASKSSKDKGSTVSSLAATSIDGP